SEQDAIIDLLRLSRSMTYKAAVTGLNLGGGKAVIIGNSKTDKSEALLRAFGRFVEGMGGRYITAEDVGTSVEDMEVVRRETRYVTGIAQDKGGGGDPSRVTARGVFAGIRAAVEARLGRKDLEGLKVAIQGVGHVGMYLAGHLHSEGARLFVSDIDPSRVGKAIDQYSAQAVGLDEIYGLEVDVFAPCALGAAVNDDTIDRLRCSVIAGGANNVLYRPQHGDELVKRNILYAPDYVVNAGGLINVYQELNGYDEEKALRQADAIYDTLREIFELSKKEDIAPYQASDRLAEKRIRRAKDGRADRLHNLFLPGR
ncbi:MAG: amino acid dehydrogenase, partial [Acidobacteriota bacterium]